MEHLLALLASGVIKAISRFGWPGVAILMFFGSAMIPIPSEVVMPFAGFLVTQGKFSFWGIIIVGSLASLAGSLAAWALGFWGGEALSEKIIRKYGRYLLIDYDEVLKMQGLFKKRGELIVFITRLMPVIRAFISLPAGFAKMNPVKFSIYSLAGAAIWNFFLTYLGFKLGENWENIGYYFEKFDFVIVIGILIAAGWYIRHKIKKMKKRHHQS